MASKQTYECYVCKRNGFADVRVFLDGKTEDGKTIYKNPDMTAHQHKQSQQQQQQQPTIGIVPIKEAQQQQEQQSQQALAANPSDRMIIAMLEGLTNKIDYVIKLLNESVQQQQQQK